jgi:hypothetical protein
VSWPLVDENTYKDEKGVHERGSRDESSLTPLCSIRWVELRHWFLGIVLLEIKGRTLPSEYRDSEQPTMLEINSHCVASLQFPL